MVTFFAMQYIHLLEGINDNFMSRHVKEKTVTISMNTVAIPNLDVKVWTRKSEFPQENFLFSVTQNKITRQRIF